MRKHMTNLVALTTAVTLACSVFVYPTGVKAEAVATKTLQLTNCKGSSEVTGLRVPTLGYDDTSINLVWDKPEKYDDIADYNVYINGKKAGTARENFKQNASFTAAYMESFYEGYKNSEVDMVDVDIHSYKAENLAPSTEYTFEVKPVDEKGNELGTSNVIKQKTTAKVKEFNIVDYGAKASKAYTTYDEKINTEIEANTKAIQKAIDACSEGGKVVIPEGTFVAGALYLKSNMTLELEKGALLWGSPNPDHYEHNYLLYPYSTDTRSWSLINAYSADENKQYENIRITGEGTINGNGWKYYNGSTTQDSVAYQSKDSLDPKGDEYNLEMWYPSGKTKIEGNAVLAYNAYKQGLDKGLADATAYATRPNLITLRGVNGIYIEGVSVKNPAFHTIAILDSENVVSNDVKYITNDCNNADGIEISNTKNAIIYNSFFDTGDDSINFATGLGNGVSDTKQQASENIWTFNNFIRNGHGGAIAAGSHTGAGICDMLVEDNVINLNQMPFRFKSAPVNGGGVYDVMIRDCAVANCKQLFVMTTSYGDANQAFQVEPADKPAEFHDISAYNITADTITKNTFSLTADVGPTYKTWHTHHDLYFKDITCTNITAKESEVLQGVENVTFDNVSLKKASKVASSTIWPKITYSKNMKFINGTTAADGALAVNAMTAPSFEKDATVQAESKVVEGTSYHTATMSLSWGKASDDTKVTSYSVDVYTGDEKVDQVDGITDTKTELAGLSTGTDYKFIVYASDATGNKVEGPSVTVKTAGEKDTAKIAVSEKSQVAFSGEGYTWALAKFANVAKDDVRVRGYRVYVNGKQTETFYLYKLQNSTETISQNVRRLTAGKENTVKIVAFTDAGITYDYEEATVKTVENYDYKAPVWGNAKLTVKKQGNDLVLSWPEATDESRILGYRVYVDGVAVTNSGSVAFNHVNGNFTTSKTTYTVSGLDLAKEHTFKVEAGDTWWKAVTGAGPYHWTLSGPSTTYVPEKEEAPVVNVTGLKMTESTLTSVTVSWTKEDKASGYEVTYKDASGKTVTKNLTSNNQTSLKVSKLVPNTSYTVTVKAYRKEGNKVTYGTPVSVTAKTAALEKQTKFVATKVTNRTLKLNWNPIKDASGYEITFKNSVGKDVTIKIKNQSQKNVMIDQLLSNTTYKFTLRPYVWVNGTKVYGDAVSYKVKTAKNAKLSKASSVKVKTSGKKTIKVTFKEVKNAAGYEVSYSLKKNSKFKTVDTKAKTKTWISNLKSGKSYYVKVRAYTYENKVVRGKVVKSKVYGSYSSTQRIKVK